MRVRTVATIAGILIAVAAVLAGLTVHVMCHAAPNQDEVGCEPGFTRFVIVAFGLLVGWLIARAGRRWASRHDEPPSR